MRKLVAYLWVENPRSVRLAAAQRKLRDSVKSFGLDPLEMRAGTKLVLFGSVLKAARSEAGNQAFVWCNSDLIIKRDPFDVPDPENVYGFHRREIPSGEITYGVDMYYIPLKWWDDYLSRDVPELYLGAGYVDWWISRAMQKVGAYENLAGYIDHHTHETSGASGSDKNSYYQRNFRSYNRWAKRNGLDPIPAPPYLVPAVGHVWGVRDLLGKILRQR